MVFISPSLAIDLLPENTDPSHQSVHGTTALFIRTGNREAFVLGVRRGVAVSRCHHVGAGSPIALGLHGCCYRMVTQLLLPRPRHDDVHLASRERQVRGAALLYPVFHETSHARLEPVISRFSPSVCDASDGVVDVRDSHDAIGLASEPRDASHC